MLSQGIILLLSKKLLALQGGSGYNVVQSRKTVYFFRLSSVDNLLITCFFLFEKIWKKFGKKL